MTLHRLSRSFRSVFQSAIAAVVIQAATLCAADEPALASVFTGKDLTGWKVPAENPFWKAADGVLVGESDEKLRGSMLYTEKSYKDVVFECEVRFSGDVDSGIMMRKPEVQVQIGVSRSLKKDMTCSFYVGKYPEEAQAKRAGELLKKDDWNKIRVQAKGDTFTVWLNGEQVSQYTNAKYKDEAPIGLQIHPNVKMKVEFRNIKAAAL